MNSIFSRVDDVREPPLPASGEDVREGDEDPNAIPPDEFRRESAERRV